MLMLFPVCHKFSTTDETKQTLRAFLKFALHKAIDIPRLDIGIKTYREWHEKSQASQR